MHVDVGAGCDGERGCDDGGDLVDVVLREERLRRWSGLADVLDVVEKTVISNLTPTLQNAIEGALNVCVLERQCLVLVTSPRP